MLIALATLLAASHWLHNNGNAGIVAGFADFTQTSIWSCDHCASFTLAALCVRIGFAVGILIGKSAQVEPRALLRNGCVLAS